MSTLTLTQIEKSYSNGFQAIHQLDLRIDDGEMVVLVGPSGCGKSTLLRMIAGLESISGGTLMIDNEVVNDREPGERDIAMVFQNYALYPHMSVYDNMAYGLRNRKTPKHDIDRIVRQTAAMLELDHLLDRKPKQLSGGQRQRVAMGRAIVRSPKVFLFDEPLSNLDAKLRVQMRLEIKRLQSRLGTTSVYVTHDQVEAMTLGDKLVVLNKGHIEQVGTPMSIYQKPASLFVATFIGAPAMNILEATINQHGLVVAGRTFCESVGRCGYRGAVKLGIRPEHITLTDSAPSLWLRVMMIESLGADKLLYCHADEYPDIELVVRVDGMHPVRVQQRIGIKIKLSDIHLFNPVTEKRMDMPVATLAPREVAYA